MSEFLVLISPANKCCLKIVKKVGEITNTSPIFSYNYNTFLENISKYQSSRKAILLCIENENDLSYLSNLKDLLSSSKIIILLPEKRKDLIKGGLSLNPSLLLFARDEDTIKLLARILKGSVKDETN